MKTIFLILAGIWIMTGIAAQVPQKMSYQAVIRDNKDSLVRNQRVSLRISILQDSVNGNVVFKEEYYPMPVTNMNGLLSVVIGTGIRLTGTFSDIDWSHGPYFIKTEADPAGNTNYPIKTVSQLLSVPYALYAKTAGNIAVDVATRAYVDALLARIEVVERHLNIPLDSVFIDARDGIQYKMVRIGNQIWMAENLKYLPQVSGIPESLSEVVPYYYVLDYNGTSVAEAKLTENYNLSGVLYNWPAAMNGAQEGNSNPSGIQGVCPAGWHLPSMNEWKQLVDLLGGEDVAAKKLMESGTSNWQGDTGATNESGFTAVPGGDLMNAWGISFGKNSASWWTSTRFYSVNENGNIKWYYYPSISGNNSPSFSFDSRYDWDDPLGSGLSVRCVKD